MEEYDYLHSQVVQFPESKVMHVFNFVGSSRTCKKLNGMIASFDNLLAPLDKDFRKAKIKKGPAATASYFGESFLQERQRQIILSCKIVK